MSDQGQHLNSAQVAEINKKARETFAEWVMRSELRKWCVEAAIKARLPPDDESTISIALNIYKFITEGTK